ncbi:hypothetical protein RMCBS344292_01595 [Rhizopus microsporus]|nr:hypothetical protein RMCBS344292_01595 [Rhizopus microsporus]
MDTTATAAETTTTTTTSAATATPIATTEGNTENTNGARTVRSNWLIYSWNRISRAHKAILIMSLILVIFQVAVTATVLAIGSSQSRFILPTCRLSAFIKTISTATKS